MKILGNNYAVVNRDPKADNGVFGLVKAGQVGDGAVFQYNDGTKQDIAVSATATGRRNDGGIYATDSQDTVTLEGGGWSSGVAAHDDASNMDGIYYLNNKTGAKIMITGGATVKGAGTEAPPDAKAGELPATTGSDILNGIRKIENHSSNANGGKDDFVTRQEIENALAGDAFNDDPVGKKFWQGVLRATVTGLLHDDFPGAPGNPNLKGYTANYLAQAQQKGFNFLAD
jgi:hypothetical protein